MAKKRLHVVIAGIVQGVMFRAATKRKADELGLAGWVKNNINGTVEAVFEGEESQLAQMLEFCWHGSPNARVDEIDVHWMDAGDFDNFEVR